MFLDCNVIVDCTEYVDAVYIRRTRISESVNQCKVVLLILTKSKFTFIL